jgi:multisubunit Na+/H+ antiporter MnhF subunit
MLLPTVIHLCMGALCLSILAALVRIARGPSVIDRLLAFDLLAVCGVGLMALLSIRWRTAMFLELILVFSLLGFLSTVAFAFYLQKTIPDRPPDEAGRPPGAEEPHD